MQRPCRLLRPGTCDHGESFAFLLVLAGMRLRLTRRCFAKQACRAAACSILATGFGAMQRQCRAEPSLAKSLEGVWQGLNEGECKLS